MEGSKKAAEVASALKGMDTSKVEVDDDEQAPPAIACCSAEEAALAEALDTKLTEGGVMERWQAFKAASKNYKELPLMCLRGRKYDLEKAAALLPALMGMIEDLGLETEAGRLAEDLQTHKALAAGTKDELGRALIWVRLRFHDPKASKARDMARLVATVMLHTLSDPNVQRLGIVVVNDMNGLKLKNLDPAAGKMIFSTVLSNLPIRVGRIVILNPPWLVGYIILPIAMSLMSAKLRSRIMVVNGTSTEPLFKVMPKSMLPTDLGGEAHVDADGFVASVLAKI